MIAGILGAVALLIMGVALFGPREPVKTDVHFDDAVLGDDVDAYFAAQEARFDDITPGAQKQVIWAAEPGAQTDLAVLYVHGYSATLDEIRPVPDNVATALGANLVYTRLAGHGRGFAPMGEASVEAWMFDVAEALAVARRVGREVIVVSTSTGSTLGAIAALDPEMSRSIKAQIMVSPNFHVSNPAAALLTWPAARYWGPFVGGREFSSEPVNARHERFNTIRYPFEATLPMAAAVKHAKGLDYSAISHPALVIISEEDKVISPHRAREVATLWGGGGDVEVMALGPEDHSYAHVIMGDALSPNQTDRGTQIMLDWIAGL
ncbi:alpha/beta hydrolase [Roseobacteraceae bacterium S113]